VRQHLILIVVYMKQIPNLGVSNELISAAEVELGIKLPPALHEIWKTYNCNELPSGWRVFPIFDSSNPRKTAGSITCESLKGVWGILVRESGLLSIANNGTGNQLVLKIVSAEAGSEIFHWSHETHKLTRWKPSFESILCSAKKSRKNIAELQKRFSKTI
jgi:hypothetical protein